MNTKDHITVRDQKILCIRRLEKENMRLRMEIGKIAETIVYLEKEKEELITELKRLK